MLDDNVQVMIENYHGGKLFLIFNETLLLSLSLSLLFPIILYSTYGELQCTKFGGRLKKPLRAFTSGLPEGNKRSIEIH